MSPEVNFKLDFVVHSLSGKAEFSLVFTTRLVICDSEPRSFILQACAAIASSWPDSNSDSLTVFVQLPVSWSPTAAAELCRCTAQSPPQKHDLQKMQNLGCRSFPPKWWKSRNHSSMWSTCDPPYFSGSMKPFRCCRMNFCHLFRFYQYILLLLIQVLLLVLLFEFIS